MDLEKLTEEQKRQLSKVYQLLLSISGQEPAADRDQPASVTRSAAEETGPGERGSTLQSSRPEEVSTSGSSS